MRKNVRNLERKNATLSRQLEMSERRNSIQGLYFNLMGGNPSNLTTFGPIANNNIYPLLTVNWSLLSWMYKTHGILQTAIDMPVLDALRGGVIIDSDQLKKNAKELEDDLEETGTYHKICEAFNWARLFGGGGLIINTGQDPKTPLDWRRILHLDFIPVTRWQLGSTHRTADSFSYYGVEFHKSRVITMAGKPAPHPIDLQLMGWGMSEIERMIGDFNRYLKGSEVIYELLEQAKIDVYRLQEFNSLLGTPEGTEIATARIQKANQIKNFNNAIILDKEDEYQQKTFSGWQGLANIMKENRIGIAAALRMPMTKLFGLSASGFNSGEDDIENYNAMIESEVRAPMKTVIRQILKLKCAHLFKMPDAHVGFQFKPLRVLSAEQEENIKKSKLERLRTAQLDLGIIGRQQAAEWAGREGLFPEDILDKKGVLEFEDTRLEEPEPVVPKGGAKK